MIDLHTRLRAVWPAIVRAKGGWPPEPMGTVEVSGEKGMTDPRAWLMPLEMGRIFAPTAEDLPDLTLHGTRAAVLAWLGLPTFAASKRMTHGNMRMSLVDPHEHTPDTFVAALERWHREHCG